MQLTYVNPPTGYTAPEKPVLTDYPKFVYFDDGRSPVIVDSAEDEAAILGKPVLKPSPAPVVADSVSGDTAVHDAQVAPAVVPVASDDKAALIAEAIARGVKIDKRWAPAKIKAALEAA